jgi:hypothetical protein
MTIENIRTPKGEVSLYKPAAGEAIASVQDFLNLMGSCPSGTIALRREDMAPEFFELKTGVAGEILQKVSNYRARLAILGDFSDIQSRALRDFIRESNATGQVVFAPDLESAVALLR